MVKTAKEIWRDYETDGIPTSGVHEPKKSEIRDLVSNLEAAVADVGALIAPTWAALAAVTGSRVYQPASIPMTETTTHTDPVVGGTVQDGGDYSWSASPAGWRRIGDTPVATAAEVATVIEAELGLAAGEEDVYDDHGRKVAFAVGDATDTAPLMVLEETGALVVAGIDIVEGGTLPVGGDTVERLADDLIGDLRYMLTDETGEKIAFGIDKDGTAHIAALKVGGLNVIGAASTVTADLVSMVDRKADYRHVLSYGQSLSRGSQGTPVVTTTQPYANLMPASGVLRRGDDASLDYTSLVPLVEAATYGAYGETPVSGALNRFVALRIAAGDTAADWVMIGTAPGQAGAEIDELDTDTVYWTWMLEQIEALAATANAAGKSYVVWAVMWVQGEANYAAGTDVSAVESSLIALKNAFALAVAGITGQDSVPPWITYQTAANRFYGRDDLDVGMGQWLASRHDPDIVMAGPIYHLPHAADDLHLTADSYEQLGRYMARAMDAAIVRGEDWRPLSPVSVLWRSTIIDIDFHVPSGALAFDTTIVAAAPNQGFDIWYAGACLTSAISSVTLVGTSRVRIVLAAAVAAGSVLTYAMGRNGDPAAAGPVTGARGNLRDSAGASEHYTDSAAATRYMHNWCIAFTYTNGQGAI